MTTTDTADTASLLRAKRQALLAQLDAVDRALNELAALEAAVAEVQELPTEEPADAATTVVPTRVAPRRMLTDDHRHALTEGRRKQRHARDAAAGRAREALDPASGLAPAPKADVPRLVKRQTPESKQTPESE